MNLVVETMLMLVVNSIYEKKKLCKCKKIKHFKY